MYVTYEEILRRAETGPLMKESDFDRLIGRTARALSEKYDIHYSPEVLVNYDDHLADRLFAAAVDFIVATGVYVTDNERVIQFTQEEVLDTIANVRTRLQYGRNRDAAYVVKRKVEDGRDPFIAFSPVGNPVDEEVFQRFIMHYAQEQITDAIFSPVLTTYQGQPVKSDVASEMEASIWNLKTLREAARMVGRPDIGICNWASTAEKTDVIIALADPAFGSSLNDGVLFAATAEMKVDQERLKKVSYMRQRGFIQEALLGPLMGGYAGGPEGTAINLAAHHFLAVLVYRTDICCTFPIHINHCTSNTPEVLWLTSLVNQALARNCNILKLPAWMSHAGPNTRMCMLEAAAYGLCAGVSGADALDIGAMTMNRHPMRWAVQEPKLGAETAHVAARMGLTRQDANTIVRRLVDEYEPWLGSVQKGQNLGCRWDECYDLQTLTPIPAYHQLKQDMVKDLTTMGLDWRVLRTEC